jgi:transcription elongation factor Elf1
MMSDHLRIFDKDNTDNKECPRCGKVNPVIVVVRKPYMMYDICFICSPCAVTLLMEGAKKVV